MTVSIKHLHRIHFVRFFIDYSTSVLLLQQGKLRRLSTSDMLTDIEDIINGLIVRIKHWTLDMLTCCCAHYCSGSQGSVRSIDQAVQLHQL